ncbi:hypothetical protein Bache_2107 [Bacteroides helcogenes P 36-108]|uniref:Uncharacterized protein n=2 Tax=Bacteroides helcogenes TaxID=290053 RepID=E6SRH5_BACT6|nr:hypothetical protein Bache_2107 [Bacteroides helcogenes P 36-108]
MTYGGMLYFPLKVSLFEEIAIELVEARFGLKGTAAEDISEQEMQSIVDILVSKDFFDSKAYGQKILHLCGTRY